MNTGNQKPMGPFKTAVYIVHDIFIYMWVRSKAEASLVRSQYNVHERNARTSKVVGNYTIDVNPLSYSTPSGKIITAAEYREILAAKIEELAAPRLWLQPAKLSAQ